MFRTNVDEVNVESINLGYEIRQGFQSRLDLAPVVISPPIAREFLRRLQLHALRCIRDRFPIGPLCCVYAPPHFGKFRFRNIHMKWTNRILVRCLLDLCFSFHICVCLVCGFVLVGFKVRRPIISPGRFTRRWAVRQIGTKWLIVFKDYSSANRGVSHCSPKEGLGQRNECQCCGNYSEYERSGSRWGIHFILPFDPVPTETFLPLARFACGETTTTSPL